MGFFIRYLAVLVFSKNLFLREVLSSKIRGTGASEKKWRASIVARVGANLMSRVCMLGNAPSNAELRK